MPWRHIQTSWSTRSSQYMEHRLAQRSETLKNLLVAMLPAETRKLKNA